MDKLFKEKYIFGYSLLIQVIYIWMIPVFLTQDGPTHLYNAKILLDLFLNNHSDFYLNYLDTHYQLLPNWFDHILLPTLLYFFKPVVAEKIFISLFIISFGLAFRYLIKTINPSSTYLVPLIFLLANSFFLFFGFYNFQWSLVFFCIFLALFLKQHTSFSYKRLLYMALMAMLIFFTHPIALIYVLLVLTVEFMYSLWLTIKGAEQSKLFKKLIALLVTMALPFLLFIQYFTLQQGGNYDLFTNNLNLDQLWALISFSYLKVFLGWEHVVITLFILLLLTHLIIGIFNNSKPINKFINVVIVSILLTSLLVYFFVRSDMAGGGWMIPRITIFMYLALLLFVASKDVPSPIKSISKIVVFILPILLLVVRYPVQKEIGNVVKDYLKANKQLPQQATILPLGFSNQGQLNSSILCSRLELFKHMNGYIGAMGSRILFDNYEANSSVSPLKWKSHLNPDIHLATVGGGIELNPPVVNISKYNGINDVQIDYVLTWGDKNRFKNNPELIHLENELTEYQLIFQSENRLSYLYKKTKE